MVCILFLWAGEEGMVLIVIAACQNSNLIITDLVDQAVFLIDASKPAAG
jgi:hypothetical protein